MVEGITLMKGFVALIKKAAKYKGLPRFLTKCKWENTKRESTRTKKIACLGPESNQRQITNVGYNFERISDPKTVAFHLSSKNYAKGKQGLAMIWSGMEQCLICTPRSRRCLLRRTQNDKLSNMSSSYGHLTSLLAPQTARRLFVIFV